MAEAKETQNFLEAEAIRSKVDEVKGERSRNLHQSMLMNQQENRMEIEEAHAKEYQQFCEEWESKLNEKIQKNQEILENLAEQHR